MSPLTELYEQIALCQKCAIARSRTTVVPGEGAENAEIMFIGEAPGWHEDQQGRPFVGPFFVEYYYEWYSMQVLKGVWAVFGWVIMGLFIGFSADLTFRFLSKRISLKLKAIITGMVLGVVNFTLTLLALMFFYKVPLSVSPVDPGSFLGVAYFCLPWLIVNSGFGGYTAYAISKGFKF